MLTLTLSVNADPEGTLMRTPPVRRIAILPLVRATPAAPLPAPAAAGPGCGGYLFFYFTHEGSATGEQIYLAVSR